MKKLTLLLTLTCTLLIAESQAQVYHSFPEDTATWVTDIYYNTCSGYCSSIFYEMKGDTVLNGQQYNKVYKRDGEFYYISPPPNSVVGSAFSTCYYVGGIRQDSINKKVYFIDSTMINDTLLYDFDLAVGDTIHSWYNKTYVQWPLIVSGVDSILINASYHKRFYFQNSTNDRSLVEGVGWSGELFGISGTVLTTFLACFNGNIIIQEAFVNECSVSLNCSISLAINGQTGKENFSFSPNPFTGKLNFTVGNNEPSGIIIYDIASRKMLQQEFTNSVSLNTENFAKGIYIYELRNKNGVITKRKVVKH